MELSKFLAKVIGIYMLIVGIAMLKDMPLFMTHLSSLIHDSPLMFVLGFIVLILGLLMVLSHNRWKKKWPVIVTIISWIVLIKGAAILLFPQWIALLSVQFMENPQAAYLSAAITVIVGAVLCYFGFRRKG